MLDSHEDYDSESRCSVIRPRGEVVTARTVTIRAKTRYRFGDQTVLVFESGEMFVKEHVHGALQFVESHRAGLTDAARRRAWKASGYRRGGR